MASESRHFQYPATPQTDPRVILQKALSFVSFATLGRFVEMDGDAMVNTIKIKENMNVRVYFKELDHT